MGALTFIMDVCDSKLEIETGGESQHWKLDITTDTHPPPRPVAHGELNYRKSRESSLGKWVEALAWIHLSISNKNSESCEEKKAFRREVLFACDRAFRSARLSVISSRGCVEIRHSGSRYSRSTPQLSNRCLGWSVSTGRWKRPTAGREGAAGRIQGGHMPSTGKAARINATGGSTEGPES